MKKYFIFEPTSVAFFRIFAWWSKWENMKNCKNVMGLSAAENEKPGKSGSEEEKSICLNFFEETKIDILFWEPVLGVGLYEGFTIWHLQSSPVTHCHLYLWQKRTSNAIWADGQVDCTNLKQTKQKFETDRGRLILEGISIWHWQPSLVTLPFLFQNWVGLGKNGLRTFRTFNLLKP